MTLPVDVLLDLVLAALGAAGVPAPLLAAAAAVKPAASRALGDLIEQHQAGAPLPTLLVPADPRDVELVNARLGLSPAAQTLPPEAVKTEPQASLEDDRGWGPSEAETANLNAPRSPS
jgi:hypothetical protein